MIENLKDNTLKKDNKGKNKELLDNISLWNIVLELEKQISIEEIKLNFNTKGYYIIFQGKKISYIEYVNIGGCLELVKFITCNGSKNTVIKELNSATSHFNNLTKVKVPFAGLVSLKWFIKSIKNKGYKSFYLRSTDYALKKGFYEKAFKLFKENHFIKDYRNENKLYYIYI